MSGDEITTTLTLSCAMIENALRREHFSFPQVRDPIIEHCVLPYFVTAIVDFLRVNQAYPTQREHFEHYLDLNRNRLSEWMPQKYDAIQARCYRAYPSITRDLHFYALLTHYAPLYGYQVVYDPFMDVQGIDHIIQYHGETINIHCFVGTQRTRAWRIIKNNRHNYAGHHVDLIITAQNSRHVGSCWLYTRKHIDYLMNEIAMMIANNKE